VSVIHPGRLRHLDTKSRASVEAGCRIVNAELQKARRKAISGAIVIVLLAAAFRWALQRADLSEWTIPAGMAWACVLLWYVDNVRRAVSTTYKQVLVPRVIAALDEGLSYSPTSSFTTVQFHDMAISRAYPHPLLWVRWQAEDEIVGTKNGVTYAILDGRSSTRELAFHGSIVRFTLDERHRGRTIVVPEREVGRMKRHRKKTRVELGEPLFESHFRVYSTDEQQARSLITTKMMNVILRAQTRLGSELRLAFEDNSLYVPMPGARDRFEIKFFGSSLATPDAIVNDLSEAVMIAERLIEVLELGTLASTRARGQVQAG
jgi:hypothetical protein